LNKILNNYLSSVALHGNPEAEAIIVLQSGAYKVLYSRFLQTYENKNILHMKMAM
jgi:hypothetical protein